MQTLSRLGCSCGLPQQRDLHLECTKPGLVRVDSTPSSVSRVHCMSHALAVAQVQTGLTLVRLQAPGSAYSSMSAAISAVVAADGVRGLWKGATPGVCVTYDEVKGHVMAAMGWRDNAATHMATAMITGIVSTTATNPVDVVKTHMFVALNLLHTASCLASGGSKHTGPIACASSLYAAHGMGGFWRGWLANYARLGPQTVVTFLMVEQFRKVMGMAPLGK
ncbi:mitochondrial carrier domain-containing protein [Scenedesmus sp. NREL 46B-D3]|nr:mitochondrial carrier domain-containing protein [Scenedesmus sp. NREL 46B-D3]